MSSNVDNFERLELTKIQVFSISNLVKFQNCNALKVPKTKFTLSWSSEIHKNQHFGSLVITQKTKHFWPHVCKAKMRLRGIYLFLFFSCLFTIFKINIHLSNTFWSWGQKSIFSDLLVFEEWKMEVEHPVKHAYKLFSRWSSIKNGMTMCTTGMGFFIYAFQNNEVLQKTIKITKLTIVTQVCLFMSKIIIER